MLKVKRFESRKYLTWVKSLPCVVCGCPADDAHHVIGLGQGGMGMKAPDYYTLPLCRLHHIEIHQNPDMWADQWEWACKTLAEAIKQGVLQIA